MGSHYSRLQIKAEDRFLLFNHRFRVFSPQGIAAAREGPTTLGIVFRSDSGIVQIRLNDFGKTLVAGIHEKAPQFFLGCDAGDEDVVLQRIGDVEKVRYAIDALSIQCAVKGELFLLCHAVHLLRQLVEVIQCVETPVPKESVKKADLADDRRDACGVFCRADLIELGIGYADIRRRCRQTKRDAHTAVPAGQIQDHQAMPPICIPRDCSAESSIINSSRLNAPW